ncbi:quinolinate synthase NadA [Thermoflavimicrobium dichotomicum]|uniref:Quinolinate synthase n=1 Tax=Thermoflavimicrobium dichotomicum TaxID=46223 RepID=A0A1I3MFC8_9BACL|nr:quinolinate synthase NadA [Thermoflavimicrobium dichotomicum]SFI95652.1 quinolinate synthase [Thermoflavimicrobium dichotomicum]
MEWETTTLVQDLLPETYRNLSSEELDERISLAKQKLGKDLVILGHHYQRDDVIQYADFRGDSLKLARIGAEQKEAKYIVFCGVHFMAETADTLAADHQIVILPDLKAGCSMADMAEIDEVEEAWDIIQNEFGDTVIPVTYVNSSAAIKAFVGRHGGTTCTSSNARGVLEWAFKQKKRILFLPDQHLGRNTAYQMGIPLERMVVWSPQAGDFEEVRGPLEEVKMILWKGHCSVHQKFTVEQIQRIRERDPEMKVIVHPECSFEVVQLADDSGSTEYIIKTVESAPAGSKWAIGTEVNLVQRLANENPDKKIVLLSTTMCPCLTMNRIDRPHLLWALESILDGEPINQIKVDDETAYWSKVALDRMLAIK